MATSSRTKTFRLIADSGGSISISPEVEMHMGLGFPDHRPVARNTASSRRLSVDVPVTVGGDMFSVMRCALATERALVNESRSGESRWSSV